MMMVRGIRGATVAEENTKESILEATRELLETLFKVNAVDVPDIASIIFSVTSDLDATFPAIAARQLGLGDTPLLCVNEIPVPDSLGKCVRILMHVNSTTSQKDIQHVYLKEAVSLRPDKTLVSNG